MAFIGIFLGSETNSINLDYQLSGYLEYANINGDEYTDILQYDYDNALFNVYYGSDNFDIEPDISMYLYPFHSSNSWIFCNLGDLNNDDNDEILINNGAENNVFGNTATVYGISENSNEECEIENGKWKMEN